MSYSPETIEIEKVVDGGLGLARIARGVALVPGTLPNETVAAHLSEIKSGVARGTLASVITPNPARAAPACPLFLACGGCDFLHTSYSYELELKQIIMAETLERESNIFGRPVRLSAFPVIRIAAQVYDGHDNDLAESVPE